MMVALTALTATRSGRKSRGSVSGAHWGPRPRQRRFDLHPNGDRFALAPVRESQIAARQDKVVFIFNFFDELRRSAPTKR